MTLLFRVFFITFGHITFHDIVLSCIFLLWTCCNITQAWTKCVKVIDSQSFRLFQLTEVKLVANRKLHSYYFCSTWFARRFFAKQKGTDQLSIENYTECRAIKSAIHYWFHWFWGECTPKLLFLIFILTAEKGQDRFCPLQKEQKEMFTDLVRDASSKCFMNCYDGSHQQEGKKQFPSTHVAPLNSDTIVERYFSLTRL